MRILFLTQILPFPPDAGPRVKTWEVLRYLVAHGHQITLAVFVRQEELAHLGPVEALCDKVLTVPLKRSRLSDLWFWVRSQFTNRPFLVERDDSRKMRSLIASTLNKTHYDVIYADQLTMTQFVFPASEIKSQAYRIFDAHNATWTILERMRANARPWLKPLLHLEASRVKLYEGRVIDFFDRILAVTEIDMLALKEAARTFSPGAARLNHFSVIPITIDTDRVRPSAQAQLSMHILTLGTLHYAPNAEGIRWFLRDVFPEIQATIPDVHLTIVGKNPPQDFLQQAARQPERITVTGYVADLQPYYDQAAVVVVPVLSGSGMRVRILEAFARGKPVVTTTIGLEGIAAIPGEDVLTADSAIDFAQAVCDVLSNPRLLDRLAKKGRQLVEERYDASVALKLLDKVIAEAVKEPGRTEGQPVHQ